MYNRYIPQADGTYRRSRVPDRSPEPLSPPPKQESHNPGIQQCKADEEICQIPVCPVNPGNKQPTPHRQPVKKETHRSKDTSIDGFLHRLIPNDFDTGDLLIVILLLLMSGDCKEEQNSALLTLLIYFFL